MIPPFGGGCRVSRSGNARCKPDRFGDRAGASPDLVSGNRPFRGFSRAELVGIGRGGAEADRHLLMTPIGTPGQRRRH